MITTVNKAIIEFMKYIGVKYIFGIPGSNSNFLKDLDDDGTIKFILTKHESSAGFMANGYSKASGQPCACFASVGPGTTNLITAVSCAYEDSQPILIISGQVPKKFHGKNALQESTGKGRTINQHAIFKEATIFSGKIYNKSDTTDAIISSYKALKALRPGPAYIEISEDIETSEISLSDNFFQSLKSITKQVTPEPDYEKPLGILKNAKHPVILAGGGVIFSNACCKFKNLAETLNCPVITSLKGKGAISEYHPLSAGCVGICGEEKANRLLLNSDCIISVGASFHQLTTANRTLLAKNAKILRFDVKDDDRNDIPNQTIIEGDFNITLQKFIKKIQKAGLTFKKQILETPPKNRTTSESEGIPPQTFFTELRSCLSPDTLLCTESIYWSEKYFKVSLPRTHIVLTGFAAIGASLSEAIGAKLAKVNKTVVSIQGDGGFLMGGLEILTSKEYNIPIISIILNNGTLGPVYHSQLKKFNKPLNTTFKNPDYVSFARSLNIPAIRIKEASEIHKKIETAKMITKKGSPVLVEVLIDPAQNFMEDKK